MACFFFLLLQSSYSHGRNNGKKLLAVRIVQHCFEYMHLQTGQNPIQILADAIQNSGPREDTTRIGSGGVVRRQAVDVSPLRRVNTAIYLLTKGVCNFSNLFEVLNFNPLSDFVSILSSLGS